MSVKVKIGTRPSALAFKQAEEIARLLPLIDFEIIRIETKGDKDKTTPLPNLEGTDFFTREIEEALINGSIDAAVHSAKDLEETQPKGLVVAAMTRAASPYDCLVSKNGRRLKDMPAGSTIGTSSAKRKIAILKFRPDLIVKDIRGNIDERLAKLDRNEFDAVIVAHAALIRLRLEDRIAEIIPKEIIKPHPYQGSLAIQVREDRDDLVKLFGSINGA